ncbi:ATP-binding protein [Sandaracinus amylolyticus]|uniref:ATP-binding protein n=1 Tax=Sandaracinus amylolyticus TaxID=927083 RepID=UPI001F37B38B|nr:ATP-binding protein [Sandaracinus amylolyticus]UJR83852.1 Hypothetical protein I5071_59230 [Sandaracinus amylolyticus]
MNRVFVRAFVSTWVAAMLIGAAFVVIETVSYPDPSSDSRRNLVEDALREEAIAVAAEPDRDAALARLRAFEERTDVLLFVFPAHGGEVVALRPPSERVREMAHAVRAGQAGVSRKPSARFVAFALGDEGAIVVARIPRKPSWARTLGIETAASKLVVLSIVSALAAWLLARYLTRPIESLRRATQRIASGDFSVRVAPELRSTDREIAALASDFDAMAARVEALVVAQRRLLSDVSHELGSPLARLRVALELARKRAGGDAQGALDRIERDALRLEALVRQILTLSALEHARLEARAPQDLTELVRAIVADAAFEAEAQGRTVRLVREGAAQVRGDGELLRRAVENVLRNAVRFTAEGSAVEVEVEAEEHDVEVRVRDHGPGVPEHALRDLFAPFFRVHADRDRRTGGVGLGLAITERAIAAHGGTVRAVNAEGGGLRITLRLPRARDEAGGAHVA